jgi:hypothetical protein
VTAVAVRAGDEAVELVADTRPGATVGLWAAAQSTGLLADALGRSVAVRLPA